MNQRRLAAIMFTDIVGYSALTQRNETAAFGLVQTQRELLRPLIAEHGGELVKSTGDGLLVEFPSALQSVKCAVAMQRAVAARNRAEPGKAALRLRIGIHLGDIEHRDGDVFGDGVNIAARIEPLATPGSIYVSEDVARQVDGKLDAALHSRGPQALKNIRRPIEVFEVVAETGTHADASASEDASDAMGSIAVLPFADMSAAKDNEYFADGITEELIDAFARIPELKVIARTSVFALKGKDLDIHQIGDKLGVATVLEGSVRRAGDRLRINAQLVKVADQSHLWSQRYDRDLGDVFAVQEEIANAIAAALTPRLRGRAPTPVAAAAQCCEPDAYSAYLQGRYLANHRTEESLSKAMACYEQALDISPDFAPAHAGLAIAAQWMGGYYGRLEEFNPRGRAAAQRALELDPDLADAHSAMGAYLQWQDYDFVRAEREFRRALELNPVDIDAQEGFIMLLILSGRAEEAIRHAEEFLNNNPLSFVIRRRLGIAHFVMRDYESALSVFRQILDMNPTEALTYAWVGASLSSLGRHDEALDAFAKETNWLFRAHGRTIVHARKGEIDAARQQLEIVKRAGSDGAYQIAGAHLALGDVDEAVAALELAWKAHDPGLNFLPVDELFDPIRDDPRVEQILARMKGSTTATENGIA